MMMIAMANMTRHLRVVQVAHELFEGNFTILSLLNEGGGGEGGAVAVWGLGLGIEGLGFGV